MFLRIYQGLWIALYITDKDTELSRPRYSWIVYCTVPRPQGCLYFYSRRKYVYIRHLGHWAGFYIAGENI
jgi:hypothetical protein